MWELLSDGFLTIFHFTPLLLIMAGVSIGIILGAIPGLTGTMAIVLITPFTFGMDAVNSITILLAIYCGGIYGGAISAILIRTPGSPANAATIFDGYELAKQGKGLKALKMSVDASVIGNTISVLALIFVAPPIAKLALRLGPIEISSLIILSLTIIGYVSGKSMIKGLISAGVGLLACTVGIDPIAGTPRLAFGVNELQRGFDLIPMSIGLFAVSEIFIQSEVAFKKRFAKREVPVPIPRAQSREDNKLSFKETLSCMRTILQSSFIGVFLGAVPGVGAPVASFMGYGFGKRFSKHPEKYGTGYIEGVAASEAANNGVVGSTLIPLLTMGIPGDLPTAILLGAFTLHGLIPGPMLFTEHPHEVYSLFAAFALCVVALYIIGRQFIKVGHLLTEVPKPILFPVVMVLCFVGSYAINSSMLDVWIMLAFGCIGYILEKHQFALAPLLVSFLLGPILEGNLRQAMILTGGSIINFFTSPISLILLVLTLIIVIQIANQGIKDMNKTAQQNAKIVT